MQHKAKTKNPLLTASPIKGLLMVSCVSYKKIKFFFSVVRSCLVKGSRGSSGGGCTGIFMPWPFL